MNAKTHSADLAQFISASPSSFHAAHEVASRLEKIGYTRQAEDEAWDVSPGGHVLVRGGAVIAWWIPEQVTDLRFAIVGAHTDSPTFKVKPGAQSTVESYEQVNVETYGGLLGNSWLNRDLELAGKLFAKSGEHLVRTGPLMVIPQLAIHLDRSAREGISLNNQQHLHPLFSVSGANLMELLADKAGTSDEILGYDLVAADTQQPENVGPGGEFFASGRQDNLLSVHAGLVALENHAESSGVVAVLAAFDHEEIGSGTPTGAAGPILETVLRRTAAGLGAASEEELQRAFARSSCLSADCGHAIHPNYQEKHDPAHRPVLGGGPLLKHNANQAYMTDGWGTALWRTVCAEADVPTQDFVSRNDVPCGSTIGPLTATRLGIRTIDVGAPLLSMHSVRELSHVDDAIALSRAIAAYWKHSA
ncbi:M18 family aminopeptidase [Flaviflexus massiliensis]|uniref:M18 family aminopeptidase n=1 Tax=Flaviflexus massiliensis TaxID=1522309 RepID=UPI0006D54582|nr:M18 family aminopeptidase [Flaviflexus massiliensis]